MWLLACLTLAGCDLIGTQALAEPVPYASLPDTDNPPVPDTAASASVAPTPSVPATVPLTGKPIAASGFRDLLYAAKRGDAASALAAQSRLSDPVERQIVLWALIDNAANRVGFSTLDTARREQAGWPRAWRRQSGAEKAIDASGLAPKAISDWFGGRDPDTPEGAIALASALQAVGQVDAGKDVIRHYWRDHIFETDLQSRMLARFGSYLTPDDHVTRLSTLLYGQQGPAAKAMMDLVDIDHKLLAEARIALRAERSDAPDAVARVPQVLQDDPGLSFDRARYYRRRNLEVVAASQVRNFPANVPDKSDVAGFIWSERRALMLALIRSGDNAGAYAAASDTGLKPGPDLAEAEFYAGWIALQRLHNAALADTHFAVVQKVAQSSKIGRAHV